jgi:hypothetical protein
MDSISGSLVLAARQGLWWRRAWKIGPVHGARRLSGRDGADDDARRVQRFRYHLGRGRRAREAGAFQQGAAQARQALSLNPNDPWALALLGQCLRRQCAADLDGARRALERAWSLDPTNGYFVGLLLDVLDAQGDASARRDVLSWAWWRGAPVERWLPGGPPTPATADAERRAGAGRLDDRRESARPPLSGRSAASPPLPAREPARA